MVERPLRVLVNGSAIPAHPAGAGTYTLELARALARRGDIETVIAAPSAVEGVETIVSPAAGPLRRVEWEQRELPRLIQREGFDVCHGAHFAVPLRCPVPRVATVHDLTFYRLSRRYSRRHRWYYRALAFSAARAERIIVPSKAVAGDAVRYLSYPPARIRVIPEAARSGLAPASDEAIRELCERLGIERPYLLCVGTAEPGKRAIDGIRALAELREQGARAQLVLAGNPGRLSRALQHQAELLGLSDAVRLLGYVEDRDLGALYSGASALLFPSLYEGFGLPPLEAMTCGTPVIASCAPAMTEVLKGAAIFVPLRDPVAIAKAAAELLRDAALRADWSGRGSDHAARFSWDRAAAETVDVYRELSPR
jgi:glycosyltransferase involved in cell wall biosynthesis